VDFIVAKADLHSCRFEDAPASAAEPGPGEALLRVDAFGLTSNNITYAMFGEAMSYWQFFPAAEDGWGRVPVWGFAEVSASGVPELEVGTRVFGYLPPSTALLVAPAHASAHGFTDASPHRAALPPAYNRYASTQADLMYDAEHEDAQMLLRPLFLTSYLIDDFLDDSDFFGADTIVLSSASSKTAGALAFQLSLREGVAVVGLTSARSAEFARTLGVYDHVVTYDELDSLPDGRAVYVDMTGDAELRAAVHGHYREQLAHSAVVGATHHDRMGQVPDALPGPRPTFFFAPDRVTKRAADWGADGLQRRMADAWHPYVEWADGWLQVIHGHGPDAVQSAYLDLLDGRIDPAKAHVLSL
jgi:NADPH:quinone reductase-like Zn-dependent oxidoreductase